MGVASSCELPGSRLPRIQVNRSKRGAPARSAWNYPTLTVALQMRLSGSVQAEIYPGVPQYIGGVSYWVPNREAGQQVVEETIR